MQPIEINVIVLQDAVAFRIDKNKDESLGKIKFLQAPIIGDKLHVRSSLHTADTYRVVFTLHQIDTTIEGNFYPTVYIVPDEKEFLQN